jgi:hypothetical protein
MFGTSDKPLAVAAVLAAWAVVAAYALERMVHNSLWVDELYMLLVARMDLAASLVQTLDYSAPLYQLLLKPFVRAGLSGEFMLRLPSLAAALAGIFYVWRLARQCFGPGVAAGSVLLIAVNPFFLYYAAEARPYMLFFFVSCASFHHYLRCLDGGGRGQGAAYFLFTTAMILCHYYGYLLLAAQGLHFLLAALADRRWSSGFVPVFWATTGMAALLLVLPFGYVLEGAPAAAWMERPERYSWYLGDVFANGRIGAAAVCAMLYAVWASWRRIPPGGGGSPGGINPFPVLILWIVFGLYPVLAVSTFFKPVFTPRHFVFLVAPCTILLVRLLAAMPRIAALAGFILLLAALSERSVGEARAYRRDFPDMVGFLNADAGSPCRIPYRPYGKGFRSAVAVGLDYYGLEPGVSRSLHDVSGGDYSFLEGPCNVAVFSTVKPYTDWLDAKGLRYRVVRFGNMYVVKVGG